MTQPEKQMTNHWLFFRNNGIHKTLEWHKVLKEKGKCQSRILQPAKLRFDNEDKIDFPRSAKMKIIVDSKSTLKLTVEQLLGWKEMARDDNVYPQEVIKRNKKLKPCE